MPGKQHNHTREQDCTETCPANLSYSPVTYFPDVVVPCVRPMVPGHWDY